MRIMTISFDEILGLSVPERIQLVEDIWDSIAASPESLPITDAQRQELDRRLDAYARDPSELRSWDEVRARLEDRG
jgi:putative addiction module component (TIGR02574 family)